MSEHQIHQYFKHETSDWSVLGFLAALWNRLIEKCNVITCLEAIVKHEKGCRRDKAQLLLNQYKQASMMTYCLKILRLRADLAGNESDNNNS
ncbi:hypothetical protein BC938DRAFT_472633 [Jimgerdemannia flammicorona]|uniref:Uncharacterized protein n=1 Tax=Jimgerdemannia flammicorona TaxID=994334 RepID=A0A433Q5P1_9FUNG|nr:hypothetical protein BC938DRAFT_472633 [Jimgerdemannia flammicorona]